MNTMKKLLLLGAVAALLIGTVVATCNRTTHKKAIWTLVKGKQVKTTTYKCYNSALEPANFELVNGVSTCIKCGCSQGEHTP
jgi:hypothetical protein